MKSVSSVTLMGLCTTLITLLLTCGPVAPVAASPLSKRASSYWVANIARNGAVAYGSDSSYTVYRNVKDYGALGNGVQDDTAAINNAITAGSRCGLGCDSSTVTPAIIYFPPGTYKVSAPIVQLYYTQFIGDAVEPPTISANTNFSGIALIDSDPYENNGSNWYTNQNNFFRQIRNFIIDLTPLDESTGTGIHWQVAQATSLQNIVFNMIKGSSSKQQGIFMDNGSGGFMSDLVFNGGNYGAFLGNQQFTTRNWTFNNCNTAIYMNWNWAWTLKSVTINDCGIGLDMSSGGPTDQTVGSVILMDSTMTNTPVGIKMAFTDSSGSSTTNGTLVIDNVDFSSDVPVAVESYSGTTILAGNTKVDLWRQGQEYTGTSGSRVQDTVSSAPSKPAAMLDSSGNFFERSKPQYESYAASAFVSIKSKGAAGDGVTDDTKAIQDAMNSITSDQILYFDHGAYVVTSTIQVPATIKITGEIWPLIMAKGDYFQSETSPQPVWEIGTAGESGAVEISDLIFETIGPAKGAIMIKWNIVSTAGQSGMWDTHVRIGGSAGTDLQSDQCAKNPDVETSGSASCEGAFLLFWAAPESGGVYLENTWFWVADHELDLSDHGQIDIYNGRGVLIESQGGPTWLYGTSSEHSVFYNYQVNNAENVFMGMIQTETPYYQANPKAPEPLSLYNYAWGSNSDPNWTICSTQPAVANDTCYKTWGLRVLDSTNVFMYGAGLYSFFDNYSQDCVDTENCQRNILAVQGSNTNVNLYAINTKASVNMVTLDGVAQALDSDNRNNFCATLARYVLPSSSTSKKEKF